MPVEIARSSGSGGAMTLLLANGLRIEVKDDFGETALAHLLRVAERI
jgi:hypothetical protein